MKIIIPMAGMGKRMRPHTLTTPKPLLPVAGKPIVQRLCEDISAVYKGAVDEIAFIIGDFGKEVEQTLINIAESLGAKGTIHYQKEALGTAHAILCAQSALKGPVTVAFADTLFRADFSLDPNTEGVIWVSKIDDPSAFGVVKTNEKNIITDFVEKPKTFVSDLAIIGIYYFKDGENLKKELQYLIDNDVVKGGEYQLTDALENMKNKGLKFAAGKVDEWLDCGNKDATVQTNQRVLVNKHKKEKLVSDTVVLKNSVIIEPCFIGENVVLENCIIGPYASIGKKTSITNSVVSNSIIQDESKIANSVIDNTMLGKNAQVVSKPLSLSLSDYSTILND